MLPTQIAIAPLPQSRRVPRSPKHSFQLRHLPYQIQPFAICPVLPGESLNFGMLQVRAKTDPIKNDLLGWWLEHYLFYVKLTDLAARETFQAMMLDSSTDLSSLNSAANTATYHAGGGIDFVDLCLDRVVDEYFRNEGESPSLLDGLPSASLNQESWLESVKLGSTTVSQDQLLPGQDGDPPDVPGVDDTLFAAYYAQYEHMRALKLVDATWEDWLKANGVTPKTQPAREDFKPELLRYSRSWQYPSTVVDGATGSATSAVVWSVAERLDKRRFFPEPGFIFGVTVARPKVYLSNQKGAATIMMDSAYRWLPNTLAAAGWTSLAECVSDSGTPGSADGPLGDLAAENYWVDLRDLLIYGDQFVNFALTETDAGLVALPTATMERRFPSSADIDALFVTPASANEVRQDGIFVPTILGKQTDQT